MFMSVDFRPVPCRSEAAVSLAVATFSLLPDPWCEAAEPAEFCVSVLVPAADGPVTGALVSAVSLAVVSFSLFPGHRWREAERAEHRASVLQAARDLPGRVAIVSTA